MKRDDDRIDVVAWVVAVALLAALALTTLALDDGTTLYEAPASTARVLT